MLPAARQDKLTGTILYLLLGPIVWGVYLVIVYGGHTLVCARTLVGSDWSTVIALFVIGTLGAGTLLIAAGWTAFTRWRRTTEPTASFRHAVMGLLAFLSAIGIAWIAATALFVMPC